MITSSSFRALQGQRVRLYLSILRSLFCFRFFKGCSLFVYSHFSFRRFTLSFSFRRLFGARQLTARVSLAHVVMSSTTGANTVPLEPNVMIANEDHEVAEADDTNHVESDLDELEEQLGIDSFLAIFSDQNSKSSSETAERVFDPSAAVVSHEVASTNEPHEEEFKLPSVFEETKSFGPEGAGVIPQRVNDACSKKAMDSKLKDLYEKYDSCKNVNTCVCLKSI